MTTTATSKTCRTCKTTKPITDFPTVTGRHQCLSCVASTQRASRQRLAEKRDAAVADELKGLGKKRSRVAGSNSEQTKEAARLLKRSRAQAKYMKKVKSNSGKVKGLTTDNQRKVLAWARRYITLTAESRLLRDIMHGGHRPFQDSHCWIRAADHFFRANVVRGQLRYIPVWMSRYLPESSVRMILADRLARTDLLLADRAMIEAGWVREEQAQIDERKREAAAKSAAYDATPDDRHPVERQIRAKHPDGVVSVWTMPMSDANDLTIPEQAYDANDPRWAELVRVLSKQEGCDYALMLRSGLGDERVDFFAKRTLTTSRHRLEREDELRFRDQDYVNPAPDGPVDPS